MGSETETNEANPQAAGKQLQPLGAWVAFIGGELMEWQQLIWMSVFASLVTTLRVIGVLVVVLVGLRQGRIIVIRGWFWSAEFQKIPTPAPRKKRGA